MIAIAALNIDQPAVLQATIDPASQPVGTVTTPWINAANFQAIIAMIQTGVMGASGTIDAKLQRATDASGTLAEDVPGKAITQIVKASGDNVQSFIVAAKWQIMGDHGFVRLSVTVGGAASFMSASLWGTDAGKAGAQAVSLPASVLQLVA